MAKIEDQKYYDLVDEMTREELGQEANRIAMQIMKYHPNGFERKCASSKNLQYVKKKMKEYDNRG